MGTEGNSGRGREERNRKGKYWEGVESKKVAARSKNKRYGETQKTVLSTNNSMN